MEKDTKTRPMNANDKVVCTVSITNEILKNTLGRVLGWERENLIALFHGLLAESHKGSEVFMNIAMGGELPYVPTKGSEVYVPINKLGYNIPEEPYVASSYNENGFIKCTVVSFLGYHLYTPLGVLLPTLEVSNDPVIARVSLGDWEYADPDFYEESEVKLTRPYVTTGF